MLLWALNPANPYGYSILLRWVCCALFVFLTLQSVARNKQGWAWTLGITATVYNPVARIHLNRDLWSVIGVVTIIVAVASIFVLKLGEEGKELGTSASSTTARSRAEFRSHRYVAMVTKASMEALMKQFGTVVLDAGSAELKSRDPWSRNATC